MSIRVLLIEDEPAIADFVVRGLREEDFEVEHAKDGDAGWKALDTGEWDIVLLDWWLPGMDGLDLLQRFRQRDRSTPVLFLTARGGISDRVLGLDSGADDYLVKPFAFSELLARVRALSRRRDLYTSAVLASADVRVDLARRTAERGGSALDLTAKEFLLLTFFLRHPSEVLSRPRIYEEVWHEQFDGLSNTLEVHVMELRRKLEARGPRLIHTQRGQGYVFGPREGPAP
jgi:two-component system copper resistance phosphate regulon response regulator CusR